MPNNVTAMPSVTVDVVGTAEQDHMQLSDVHLSVPSSPVVVGLLLWARRAGDIDRVLPDALQQPSRSSGVRQANAGSVTLSADVDC